MHNTHHFRPAVAMIELIFALVVMGLVLTSVPQLLTTASSSGYVAIQQESISEAATQVNIIMGYAWDENNTIEGHETVLLANGDGDLNATGGIPKRRAGTPRRSQRLFISYDAEEFNATRPADLGADAGDLDDIDDFNGVTTLYEAETSVNSDYIEKGANINISRTVSYMDDNVTGGTYINPTADNTIGFAPAFNAALANTSNIKHIQVTLTSTSNVDELNKSIVLHAFSCNIGSYTLEER